jgi:hypothetical protein
MNLINIYFLETRSHHIYALAYSNLGILQIGDEQFFAYYELNTGTGSSRTENNNDKF